MPHESYLAVGAVRERAVEHVQRRVVLHQSSVSGFALGSNGPLPPPPQRAEATVRRLLSAALESLLWKHLAILVQGNC
jgi:hypothetical protein